MCSAETGDKCERLTFVNAENLVVSGKIHTFASLFQRVMSDPPASPAH